MSVTYAAENLQVPASPNGRGLNASCPLKNVRLFGRIKDGRRVHTRYDRCAHTFMSTICITATVIIWL